MKTLLLEYNNTYQELKSIGEKIGREWMYILEKNNLPTTEAFGVFNYPHYYFYLRVDNQLEPEVIKALENELSCKMDNEEKIFIRHGESYDYRFKFPKLVDNPVNRSWLKD